MPHSDSLMRAANNVLTRSFGLRKDQNLLIFVDSGSQSVADVVTRAARRLGISASIVFVTHFMQSEIAPSESLPLPVEAAIREADAVLSCLSDHPEHLQYRLRVLRTAWSRRTKLAHAPGMNLDILRMADTDYGFINECGQLLALALLLGKQMEIVTRDSQGNNYRLMIEIGGWNCPPGVSDGVIHVGAWANLPPGEVYTVPQDGDGQIVINGSLPGLVLGLGDEVILTFRGGRLIDWQPADSRAARHLYESQIAYAMSLGDPNWSNLAEVGFGLNPTIKQLAGIELVDEKKAGTLHVALGHSISLGGSVDSVIHCDLVVENPTVRVDGRLLLDAGRWSVSGDDWRSDHQTALVPDGWWESFDKVCRSGIRAVCEHDRLICQWNSGRGRTDSTPVGSACAARLTAKIYTLLPEDGTIISKADLLRDARHAGVETSSMPGLLWVMRQYGLIRLPGEHAP